MNLGPAIRFSGNGESNTQAALKLLNSLNSYVPQITQLINNGADLYTAIQRVVSLFNSRQRQNAQVEQATPTVRQYPMATPIIRAFWDPSYGRFRLAQWNYQYQRWYWI